MSAGVYNITCEQYSTFTLSTTWENNGSPIDLTSYSADSDVVDGNGNIQVSFSTTDGTIVLGGITGTVTLTQSATVTSGLIPGNYTYDIVLTSGSGAKTRYLQGFFTITPGVTPS